MVTLYTTNCPKCKVLKAILDRNHIEYMECENMDEVITKGIMSAPVLKIDARWLDFTGSIKWLNEQKGV